MENLAKTLGIAQSTTTDLAWGAEVLAPALKHS